MNKQGEFNDLVQFSEFREAEPMANILKDGDVTFKLTKPLQKLGALLSSSREAVIIQVLNEDLNRAKKMLEEYRKTLGVPFS
jgi:sugar diacid utilization regulator